MAAKDKAIKKAMGKDKDKKEESTASDTDKMIEELNKQYELMLVGGAQDALGLTASARIIADESLYDGAKFVTWTKNCQKSKNHTKSFPTFF